MNIINVGFCYSLEKNKNYWQIVLTTICQMLSKCSNDNFYNIHIICKKHLEFDKFEEIIHQTIAFKNFKIIHIEPTDDFNNYSYRH
ncbi:hypothetical protein FACS189459_6500 [Bacilli bacterium]|nr:hypothetical protein FACS189459_6500 [Bacilli bacterium]